MNAIPSKILENTVNQIAKLPGIGKRSALRLALHILKESHEDAQQLGQSIIELKKNICYCNSCFNISDTTLCEICASNKRDQSIICIVEDIRDVIAIENTNQYNGIYHVLGGVISPIEGIGPSELTIQPLIEKVKSGSVKELIIALKSTIEGDTTSYFIFKQLKGYTIKTSTIARGIGIGDELEYTDELTLGRSIINRIPYETSLIKS